MAPNCDVDVASRNRRSFSAVDFVISEKDENAPKSRRREFSNENPLFFVPHDYTFLYLIS